MSSASSSKAMPRAASKPKRVLQVGGFIFEVDEAAAVESPSKEIPQEEEESASATPKVVPNSTGDVKFEAANYLQITKLFDMVCKSVAESIDMKPLKEVGEFLNIQNDFTAEEEAAIRAENEWAFKDDP